ncbi:MAG TPA: hypothetical protein VLI06_11080 [Solimonas sp.]|nr:hypothetical protein [Solimonas sp.]
MKRTPHSKEPDDNVVVGQQRYKRPASKGKGAVIGPSRQPRRRQPTDASIGKGMEEIRPRDQAREEQVDDHNGPHQP